MNFFPNSRNFSPLLLASLLICLSAATFVHGWNDDSEILKWNPNWLSAYKYSSLPLGLRGRGYLYKRLNSEAPFGFRWSPSFLYTPFNSPQQGGDGRKRKGSIAEELNLPVHRSRVLGWYNGPGSSYDLVSGSTSGEDEDKPQDDEEGVNEM